MSREILKISFHASNLSSIENANTQREVYLQFTKKLTNGANPQSLILEEHSVGQSNVRLLHELGDTYG